MALSSLPALKAYLGVTNTADDQRLTQLLEAVETRALRYMRRTDFNTATYTEYPVGSGGPWIRLREWNPTSITSVHVDPDREFGSSTLLATTQYALINKRLFRVGGIWPAATERTFGLLRDGREDSHGVIQVVYVAGGAVPADIIAAVHVAAARNSADNVGHRFRAEVLDGYSYELATGGSSDEQFFGKEATNVFRSYRRQLIP